MCEEEAENGPWICEEGSGTMPTGGKEEPPVPRDLNSCTAWRPPERGEEPEGKVKGIPLVPVEGKSIGPNGHGIRERGHGRVKLSVVPSGKQVHLERASQGGNPAKGARIEGPFCGDWRETGALVRQDIQCP